MRFLLSNGDCIILREDDFVSCERTPTSFSYTRPNGKVQRITLSPLFYSQDGQCECQPNAMWRAPGRRYEAGWTQNTSQLTVPTMDTSNAGEISNSVDIMPSSRKEQATDQNIKTLPAVNMPKQSCIDDLQKLRAQNENLSNLKKEMDKKLQESCDKSAQEIKLMKEQIDSLKRECTGKESKEGVKIGIKDLQKYVDQQVNEIYDHVEENFNSLSNEVFKCIHDIEGRLPQNQYEQDYRDRPYNKSNRANKRKYG